MPVFSLYGEYGIGTFGKSAYEFADALCNIGASVWQVLPLCPVDASGSPYSSPCCDGFNPYFIDPEILYEKGLITRDECLSAKAEASRVDYKRLAPVRTALFEKAYYRYKGETKINDYGLFTALKNHYGGAPWWEWSDCANYDSPAVKRFASEHIDEVKLWSFVRSEALAQWQNLRAYTNKKGIEIIGDMPFYVSLDSVDVWKHRELFALSGNEPTLVAGVPPDYFSEDGQLWGNPVYDWENEGVVKWWNDRLDRALKIYDRLRLDHFRAFDAYYAIPYGRTDARVGEWKKGIGYKFFEDKSDLPIIAEDLGTYTPSLGELLTKTGYPGMRVLQFGLNGDERNPHALDNIVYNCVCYTGTHDNAPLKAFIESLGFAEKRTLTSIIGDCDSDTATDRLIERGCASPAKLFIAPLTDLLHKGESFRINTPSTVSGYNWSCRISKDDLNGLERIGSLIKKYNRA